MCAACIPCIQHRSAQAGPIQGALLVEGARALLRCDNKRVDGLYAHTGMPGQIKSECSVLHLLLRTLTWTIPGKALRRGSHSNMVAVLCATAYLRR